MNQLINKHGSVDFLKRLTKSISMTIVSFHYIFIFHDLILYIAFICLENLTFPYKHPCMMDLKMGSVAYNPKKSQKQQLKILNSTSGCFSFRISGMEVYKTIDKKIIFRNKYWGRSIKKDEIVDSLGMFFYNGKYSYQLKYLILHLH